MYRVEWLRAALDELAAVWTDADPTLRRAVTRASDMIDQRLRTNPTDEGESARAAGESLLFLHWQSNSGSTPQISSFA